MKASDPKIQKLSIASITIDPEFQPRAKGLNAEHVEEIAEAYRNSEDVDPPVVWKLTDGKGFKLSQGFHRIEAARRAGLTHLECVVNAGTELKCFIDAMTANRGHGLKRSNDDKRSCVAKLLQKMPDKTDPVVAQMAGVGKDLVASVRKDVAPQLAETLTAPPQKREGKDGKMYPASKPKPAPAVEVAAEPNAPAEPVTLPDAEPPPAEQPSTGDADDAPAEVVEVAEPAEVPAKPDPFATLIDPLGNSIPRGVRDTFGDPAMKNAVERIRAVHAELVSIANHVKGPLARKGHFWPFASCGKSAESLLDAADKAAVGMSQIEGGLPYCVCVKCKGDGCHHCLQSGCLPKWKYDNRATYGV